MNQTMPSDAENKPVGTDDQGIEFLNGSNNSAQRDEGPPLENETLEFMERLERDIEDEVRAKRAAGAFPPAFERRLRTIFESLVPPGAGNSRRDFEALLRSSDRAAYFDIDVPIASRKPGVAKLKKILRTTQAWYLNYLTQQLNNFSTNLMRLLYVFDSRVKRLEDSSDAHNRRNPGGIFSKPHYPDSTVFVPTLIETFEQCEGRLLVADCGDGWLVGELKKAGHDCYGVDSFGELLEHPPKSALDLRIQEVAMHLHDIADESLDGIVMQGSIDVLSKEDKLALIIESGRTLRCGGILAVLGTQPTFFSSSDSLAIQRDLSAAGPFAQETVEFVLARLGFDHIELKSDENFYLVTARTKDSKNTPVTDER